MTTQEYIQSPQFEVIGMGIKIDDNPVGWFEGKQYAKAMLQDIADSGNNYVLVCHNTLFDYSIITHHFPFFKPSKVFCTMSMARSLGIDQKLGASLSKLATYLQEQGIAVPDKGNEVVMALGKRLADFTEADLAAYGQYCKTDVAICHTAFHAMFKLLPLAEYAWQDIVIRMHAEPTLRL
ncbi:hypothetical protein, partial [Pelistega indica]|uniref:hypothetical protein n=1 Tax=Pelistega indica TaxID=1414851 RepID=UPI0011CC9928